MKDSQILIGLILGILLTVSIAYIIQLVSIYNNPAATTLQLTQPKLSHKEHLVTFAQDKMEHLTQTDYWSHNKSDACDYNCRITLQGFRGL